LQAKPNLKVSLIFRRLGLMAPPSRDPYLEGQQSRTASRSMATTVDGKDPTGLIRASVSSMGIACRHAPNHRILCDGISSRGGATRRSFGSSSCLAPGRTCSHPLKPNPEAHAPEAGWIAATTVLIPGGVSRPGPPRRCRPSGCCGRTMDRSTVLFLRRAVILGFERHLNPQRPLSGCQDASMGGASDGSRTA
jgi:hypothetical protein